MSDPATVGAIASVVGTVFGIGESLFGGSSISMPKLQMPQIQNFKIPQTDLQQLNQQIAQNTQLSDQARQAAMQAINGYNQGQLSEAYAGMYQDQYNKAKQQILQQLAAQGFTTGSTQYTNAMQNLETWAANLKSQLLQKQLDDGLRLAGLSDNAIKDLESSWQTQSGINAQNNAANIEGTNAYNQAQLGQTQAQMLNQQIAQNTQLSDQARQAAMQAINGYNQGQLSEAYAGMYQDQYNKAKQQILQQLAAQGFTEGSTQYTSAMQNLETWAANLKSQLLQKQLDDGLRLAGLSDNAIKDLESSWQTQSGINAQNNAANIEGTNAYNQAQLGQTQAQMLNQQLQQQKYGNIANAVQGLGGALGKIGSGGTGSITSTGDIGGQYSSNPVGYQTAKSDPMGAAGLPTFGSIFGGQSNG
jgi:hypothetical protein